MDHADHDLLETATDLVNDVLKEVDIKSGEAKCQHLKEQISYLEESQRSPLIEESTVVLCDGMLKNSRGTVSTQHLTPVRGHPHIMSH